MVVKGHVDVSVLAEKPRWGYLMFHRLKPSDPPTANGEQASGVGYDNDGKFLVDDLTPGRYRVVFHAQSKQQTEFECGVLDVPPMGLADVKLVPQVK